MSEKQSEYEVALEQVHSEIPAPEQPKNEHEEIEEMLYQCGLPANSTAVMAIDKAIDERALRRAGEAIRQFALKLPKNCAASIAMRRVLIGDGGESLRDEAKASGVSHVAIFKAEKRIRKWMGIRQDENRG